MKWEYLSAYVNVANYNDLNAFGDLGWNLVQVMGSAGTLAASLCIFKRPIYEIPTLNGKPIVLND
jgi:hypothetical protein